jgi:hypothetical protein
MLSKLFLSSIYFFCSHLIDTDDDEQNLATKNILSAYKILNTVNDEVKRISKASKKYIISRSVANLFVVPVSELSPSVVLLIRKKA